MAKKNWHKYLRDFCDGLGTTDPAQVSNASFVGRELFGLWMPEDYQRKGKAGVFSRTVIREVYLLDLRGWKPNGAAGKNNAPEQFEVGEILSGTDREELRLASVYLSLNGARASVLFSPEEEERARSVRDNLQREKSALG